MHSVIDDSTSKMNYTRLLTMAIQIATLRTQLMGFTNTQYNKWQSTRYETNGCYHEADFLYQGEVHNVTTCTMERYPWCPNNYIQRGVQETRGGVLCTRWLLDGHKCYSTTDSPVFRVCVSKATYYQVLNRTERVPREPYCSPDVVFLSIQPNTYTTYDPFNQTAANRQAYPYGKLAYPRDNQTCMTGYKNYDALYTANLPMIPTHLDYKMQEMRRYCQAATVFLSSDILLMNSRYGRQGAIFPCPQNLNGDVPLDYFTFLPMCITQKTFLMAYYSHYLPPHLCIQITTVSHTPTSTTTRKSTFPQMTTRQMTTKVTTTSDQRFSTPYKSVKLPLPYDIPIEDRKFINLTLIPFDDQPWKLTQKPRQPPTQKLTYQRYTNDLYPPNLSCKELEEQGYCQRTYYATKINQRILTEQLQVTCPHLCNPIVRIKRNTPIKCTAIKETEDCYEQQTIQQCQQEACHKENCKVTLNICSQDTYLGYIYNCTNRENVTLWNYNKKSITHTETRQVNWMQYHPHTSIVKGYAISAVTWNNNRTAYRQRSLTKQHLWAVYNYVTTICTTPTSTCYQAQQTPVYKNGAQFQWEIVHATWTANQPLLKGNQFINCLSFMGKENDNKTLQILQSYHMKDIPVTTNLTTKQEYFADGYSTLCPRLNQWIIFKRPQQHILTPFQMKESNITITLNKDFITIPGYNLTLPIIQKQTRNGQQYHITQTHQLITPPEVTPEMMRYQQPFEIFNNEITPVQQQNLQRIWIQHRQLQSIQDQLTQLIQLTTYQQKRTKQLGDLTAHYQCQRIKDYQPIWTRQLDQSCYHQLPVILPNTEHLPLSACVWKQSLPAFLQQLATYLNHTEITKETLLHRWMYQVQTSTAQTYEQLQSQLLRNISKEGLTYTCPFSPNPAKIVFVDIPSRQIVQPTNIDCHKQYPTYIQYKDNFYEITNHGELVKLDNQQVNERQKLDKVFTKLPNDHWEEKVPQTVHYDSMPTIVAQARHQQFNHKLLQLQQTTQQVEHSDINQLRRIITTKEDVENKNWNELLKLTTQIQERQASDYSQYQQLSLTLRQFQQTIANLSNNQLILRRQVAEINATTTYQITQLQSRQQQLKIQQGRLIREQHQLQHEYQLQKQEIIQLKEQQALNAANITRQQKHLMVIDAQIRHQAEQVQLNHLRINRNENNIQTLKQKQRILALKVATNTQQIQTNTKKIKENDKRIKQNAINIDIQSKRLDTEIKDRKQGDQKTLHDAQQYAKKVADQAAQERADSTSGPWHDIQNFFSNVWKGLTGGLTGLLRPLWDLLKSILQPILMAIAIILSLYLAWKLYFACKPGPNETYKRQLKKALTTNPYQQRQKKIKEQEILKDMLLAYQKGDWEQGRFYAQYAHKDQPIRIQHLPETRI